MSAEARTVESDAGAAGVAFVGGVAASGLLAWLAVEHLHLAAVVGIFLIAGTAFGCGVMFAFARHADDRLYGWGDTEPVPYELVDEVAARRDAHARRPA